MWCEISDGTNGDGRKENMNVEIEMSRSATARRCRTVITPKVSPQACRVNQSQDKSNCRKRRELTAMGVQTQEMLASPSHWAAIIARTGCGRVTQNLKRCERVWFADVANLGHAKTDCVQTNM